MSERADQTRALLAWGFANFETANVQPANQVLAKAKVWFGKENEVQVGLAENFNVTMPKGKADGIKTQLVVQPNLNAPLQKVKSLVSLLQVWTVKLLLKNHWLL